VSGKYNEKEAALDCILLLIPNHNLSTNLIIERRDRDSMKTFITTPLDKPIFDNQEDARREKEQLGI
jgi:hypothetical protein